VSCIKTGHDEADRSSNVVEDAEEVDLKGEWSQFNLFPKRTFLGDV